MFKFLATIVFFISDFIITEKSFEMSQWKFHIILAIWISNMKNKQNEKNYSCSPLIVMLETDMYKENNKNPTYTLYRILL